LLFADRDFTNPNHAGDGARGLRRIRAKLKENKERAVTGQETRQDAIRTLERAIAGIVEELAHYEEQRRHLEDVEALAARLKLLLETKKLLEFER
jgi:uncharacterized protein with von Willebrand factor type A (vWA) domain